METGTQECKLHYCTLATVLPVGIFHTDVAGHYFSVNECWCEIAGITEAEALGDGWVQVLYPEDKERVFVEWYRAVQQNLPFRAEYRFQHPDGKITWVLGQAVAQKDETGTLRGYIGTITDITDACGELRLRKRTEEDLSQYCRHLEQLVQERTAELRLVNEQLQQEISDRKRVEQTQARLAAILEATTDVVATSDLNGHPLYINRAGRKLVGLEEEGEILPDISDFHPSGEQERIFNQMFPTASREGVWRGETVLLHREGREIPVSLVVMAHKSESGTVEFFSTIMRDISEYKRIETELLQANERFHLAAAAVNFTIYDWDIDKNSVQRTEGLIKLLGYRPQEAEPTKKWWLDRIHPDDRRRLQPLVSAALAHEKIFAFEYRICNKDNQYLHIWDHGLILRDADGRAVRVVGSMMDITERKQAEEQLRSTQEFLAKLLDHTPAPIYINTADTQRLGLVNRAWEELVGMRREEVIDRTLDEVLPPALAQQCKEVNQRVFDTGDPVITEEFADVADGRHYFHTVKFPLYDTLGQIEAVVGISLDITDRKQAEESLRQSEERFRQMAENIHEVFWMADLELTQIFYVSPAYEEIWGRTCASLYAQPRSFMEAIHPDDRERVLAVLEQHRQSGFSQEYRIVQPDGTVRWIWERAFPVRDKAGQLYRLVGVSQDISDRKLAEESLRESQERLQLFIDHAPAAVAMFDRQMRYIAVSHRWLTDFNLENQAIIGKSHYEVFPEIPERWKEVHQRCLKGAVERCESDRFERANGDTTWVRWEIRPWHNREGIIGGIVIFTENITDRKQAEEALRESREHLQLFIDHAPAAVAMFDRQMHYVAVSRRWLTDFNLEEKSTIGRCHYDVWQDMPEHWQEVHQRCLKGAVEQCESDFWERANREKIWLRWEVRPWYDRNEEIGGIVVFSEDITDRKLAEEALRQSEERFRLLAENSTDMISRHTPEEGIYLYASPACQTLLGYAPEDLVGHSAYEFFHPDDLAQIRRGHVTILNLPVTYTVAYRHRCKDGHYIWLETTCRTIRDQQTGTILEIQSASRDITERKRAEEALRQQFKREQLMTRMTQRIHQSLNLEEILNTTVAEVRQFLECDRVIIYRFQSHGSGVVVVESVGSEWIPLTGTVITDCYFAANYFQPYQQGRVQAIEDIYKAGLTPCHLDLLARFQVRANLVVPIVQEKQLWGLLVAQQCSETRQWQPMEIDLLRALATQAAIALQQAELYEQSRTATAKAQTQAQQLEQALSELQKTQAQLVHSEKMSSLGQLVAGVAHEINNPVTFISANVIYVEEYTQDLLRLIQLYQEQYPNSTLEIQSETEKIDLVFLIDDLPRLLTSMKVGAERICEIVSTLRNFSRHAEAEIKAVDIHDGLDSTLMILQHRLKAQGKNPGIEAIKEYGNLPKVECYAGQLNQVFMNLLTNAIDALEEFGISRQSSVDSGNTTENVNVSTAAGDVQVAGAHLLELTTDKKPTIWIRTKVLNDQQVVIRIADNGVGMTEQVKARLFDPFFTTKPVGAGTGLGLSISYQIVVKKHGGQLHCLSKLGQGTELVIQIPIKQRKIGVLD